MFRSLLCLLVAFMPALALGSIEESMTESIDTHFQKDGLEFLKSTVDINSGTKNAQGVKQVADLYEKALKELGFSTSRIDLASVQRGCHLIAEHPGKKGKPRFLLLGHLDTVFEPKSEFLHFEKLSDGMLKGPGVSDMKGGNQVILEALRALKDAGVLQDLNVTVVLSGDEEDPGRDANSSVNTTRQPLAEIAKGADYALGFEPPNKKALGPIVARRGYSPWSLSLSAKTGHSSQIFTPGMGPGALFPLSKILTRFERELRKEKLFTFNVGVFSGGGDKLNVIPAKAEVKGEMRFINAEQLQRVRARMKKIIDSELAEINRHYSKEAQVAAEITFHDENPGMAPRAANEKLLKLMSRVSEDLGYGKMVAASVMEQGAGDIAYISAQVGAAMDDLGPVGVDYHTVNEEADPASIAAASKRAAVLIYRLSKP